MRLIQIITPQLHNHQLSTAQLFWLIHFNGSTSALSIW